MSDFVIHEASSRGKADHGWLKSSFSFSFSNHYDPERMHFGMLRVLNDDFIEGGKGFGTHPHDNMEIITIPFEGALEHKDSMGNSSIIKAGDVQVMSAGTGITHSEFNHFEDKPLTLFQIWIYPNKKNVTPRYQQISLDKMDRLDKLQQVLSPVPEDEGVWIHQDAWFYMGKFSPEHLENYTLKNSEHGVYLMVIEGSVEVNGHTLAKKDAIGIWNSEFINMRSIEDSEILLMEIPMQ